MALLQIRGLCKTFGGLKAINNVSFDLLENEILGIIGPNGAGKTTLYNLVTGYLKPTEGQIFLKHKDITGIKPSRIAQLGIVRTFQAATVFENFSLYKNMLIANHLHAENSFLKQILNSRGVREREHSIQQRAIETLKAVGLEEDIEKPARSLPYGQQKILALCMALAADPKVILLDEPLTGMNKEEAASIMDLIEKIRKEEKLTFVIVEHNIGSFLNYCDRIIALNYGEKIAQGTPEEVVNNRDVIIAYLGEMDDSF